MAQLKAEIEELKRLNADLERQNKELREVVRAFLEPKPSVPKLRPFR